MRLEPEMNPLHLQQLAYTYMMARDYEAAAPLFRERIKILPKTDTSRGYLVSVLGHLGRIDEAQIVWAELKTINPHYSLRKRLERRWFKDPADFERLLDGMRRAGIPEDAI